MMNEWNEFLRDAAETAIENGISVEEFLGAALELWDESHALRALRKKMTLSRNAKNHKTGANGV